MAFPELSAVATVLTISRAGPQEPVSCSYPEMKKQVNTLYLGRKKSSLAEDQRKAPLS